MDRRPDRPQNIDGIKSNPINQRHMPVSRRLTPDYLKRKNTEQPIPRRSNPVSLADNNLRYISRRPDNISDDMKRQAVGQSSRSMLNTTIPSRSYGYGQNPSAYSGNKPNVKKSKKKWSRKRKVVTSILVVLVLILGIGGWFGSRILGDLNKIFHGNIFSDVQALFSTTRLRGEAQGRVNILLAGYQGTGSPEGPLTDSIMVVSLDTRNNTAFAYSIPRDLWVNVPGMGRQKINAANTVTNFSKPGYFKGGMGDLQWIIENDLGIPIQYYALINYNAFEQAVNAVGGITVNIKSPDPRGLYDPNVNKAHGGPLRLPNGPVKLDGLQALALALARGDSPYAYGFPLSDINREQHQRQELIALEQKALSAGVLSNPLKVTHLFDAIGNNVRTDLSLADALRLVQLSKKVNINNIKSYGLNYSGSNALLKTYLTSNGQDALIPAAGYGNYSQIKHYYLSITSNNPVVQENASVVVLNGSNVANLAHTEANVLSSKGFNVVNIGNASNVYPGTMIVDNSNGKDPSSRQMLQQLFPGTITSNDYSSSEARQALNYNANFVVILGQNWQTNNPSNASGSNTTGG
jgi:LCP family protein required for cell wall assembly